MRYINNTSLKALLESIVWTSDLSKAQWNVLDNACRLHGAGRGLSRSKVLRLLQTLDTLTYDTVEKRLNSGLKGIGLKEYSPRSIALYLAVCRNAASQLAHMFGIQPTLITVSEGKEVYKPSNTDKRVFTVAQRMLPKGACYLIVSMHTLKAALRLHQRTIKDSLNRLNRHGYILCLGGDEGANFSISFKCPVHESNVSLLQAA